MCCSVFWLSYYTSLHTVFVSVILFVLKQDRHAFPLAVGPLHVGPDWFWALSAYFKHPSYWGVLSERRAVDKLRNTNYFLILFVIMSLNYKYFSTAAIVLQNNVVGKTDFPQNKQKNKFSNILAT